MNGLSFGRELALAAGCVLLAAGSAGHAQERREVPPFRTFGTAPSCPGGTAPVGGFVERYRSAWGDEDSDALAALHSADTEWINAYARMFRGAEALRDFLENRLFPEFDPATSREEAENMRFVSVRYVGDDAAIVHLYTDGHRGPSRVAGEEARRTHLHLVLERRDCDWRVVHTAIMDAR